FDPSSPSNGALVGMLNAGGFVLVTTDGGKTWSMKLQFEPPLTDAGYSAYTAWFHGVAVRGNHIWVSGDDGLRISHDFGATWSGPTFESPGWTAGTRGVVYRSDDFGATWQRMTEGTTNSIAALEFPTATRGYAVGELGAILITDNSGDTWRPTLPAYPPYLAA